MAESRSTPDLSSVGGEAPKPSGEASSTAALQPPVPQQPSHKEKIFAEIPVLGHEAPLIKKLKEFKKTCEEFEKELETIESLKSNTEATLGSLLSPFLNQGTRLRYQQENKKKEVALNFYNVLDGAYYKIGDTGKSGIRDLLGLLSRGVTPLLAEESGVRGRLFLLPISAAIRQTEQTVQSMLVELEKDLEGKKLIERKAAHDDAVAPLKQSAEAMVTECSQLARLDSNIKEEEGILKVRYQEFVTNSESIKELHKKVDAFWQNLKSKIIQRKLPQKVVLEDEASEEHARQVTRLDAIMQNITASSDQIDQIKLRTQQYKATLDVLLAEYNACKQRLVSVEGKLTELKIPELEGRIAEFRSTEKLDQITQLRAEIKLKKEKLSEEKTAAQVIFGEIKSAIEQAETKSAEDNKTNQFRGDKQHLQSFSTELQLKRGELRALKQAFQSKINTLRQAVFDAVQIMTSLKPNNLSELEGAVRQLREIKSQYVLMKEDIEGMHTRDSEFVQSIKTLLAMTGQLQQALDQLKSQIDEAVKVLVKENKLKQEISNLLDDGLSSEFSKVLQTRRTEEYYQGIFASAPFGQFELSGTIYRDFTIAISELNKLLEHVKQDQLQFGNAGTARPTAEGRVVPAHEIAISYGEHSTCLVPAIEKYTALQKAAKEFLTFLNQFSELKFPVECGAGRETQNPCSSILPLIDDLGMKMTSLRDDLVNNACVKLLGDVAKLEAAKEELEKLVAFFQHTKAQYQSLSCVIREVDEQMEKLQSEAAKFEALVECVGQLPHARTQENDGSAERQKNIVALIADRMALLEWCLQKDETCREGCRPAQEQMDRIDQVILTELGKVERTLTLLQGDEKLSEDENKSLAAQCERALAKLGARRSEMAPEEKKVSDRIVSLERQLEGLERSLDNIEQLKAQEQTVLGKETIVRQEYLALLRRNNYAVYGELYKRLLRKFLFTGKSREKLEELRQHKEAKHNQDDLKGRAIDKFLTGIAATANLAELQQLLTDALLPTSDFAKPKAGSWSDSFNWTSTTAQLGQELQIELNRIIAEEASAKLPERAPITRGILADIAQVKRDFGARENPGDPMPALSFDMPYAAFAAACFASDRTTAKAVQDHLLAIQNSNMSPQQKLIRLQLLDKRYINTGHSTYSDLRVEETPSFALHYQQLVFLLETITTSRTQIMQDLWRELDRIAVFEGLSEKERDDQLKEKVAYYYLQIRESVNGSEGIFFGSGSPFGDALYYFMVNELGFEPDPERKNDSRVKRKAAPQDDSHDDEVELMDASQSRLKTMSSPSLLPQENPQTRSHTVFWRDRSPGCLDAPLKQIKRLFTCGGSSSS